ncbi:MAG: hypothetical protein AABZ06_01485 [Bdellovibrionota bacterium]
MEKKQGEISKSISGITKTCPECGTGRADAAKEKKLAELKKNKEIIDEYFQRSLITPPALLARRKAIAYQIAGLKREGQIEKLYIQKLMKSHPERIRLRDLQDKQKVRKENLENLRVEQRLVTSVLKNYMRDCPECKVPDVKMAPAGKDCSNDSQGGQCDKIAGAGSKSLPAGKAVSPGADVSADTVVEAGKAK